MELFQDFIISSVYVGMGVCARASTCMHACTRALSSGELHFGLTSQVRHRTTVHWTTRRTILIICSLNNAQGVLVYSWRDLAFHTQGGRRESVDCRAAMGVIILAGKWSSSKGIVLCIEKKYNTSPNLCSLQNVKSIWREKKKDNWNNEVTIWEQGIPILT